MCFFLRLALCCRRLFSQCALVFFRRQFARFCQGFFCCRLLGGSLLCLLAFSFLAIVFSVFIAQGYQLFQCADNQLIQRNRF